MLPSPNSHSIHNISRKPLHLPDSVAFPFPLWTCPPGAGRRMNLWWSSKPPRIYLFKMRVVVFSFLFLFFLRGSGVAATTFQFHFMVPEIFFQSLSHLLAGWQFFSSLRQHLLLWMSESSPWPISLLQFMMNFRGRPQCQEMLVLLLGPTVCFNHPWLLWFEDGGQGFQDFSVGQITVPPTTDGTYIKWFLELAQLEPVLTARSRCLGGGKSKNRCLGRLWLRTSTRTSSVKKAPL